MIPHLSEPVNFFGGRLRLAFSPHNLIELLPEKDFPPRACPFSLSEGSPQLSALGAGPIFLQGAAYDVFALVLLGFLVSRTIPRRSGACFFASIFFLLISCLYLFLFDCLPPQRRTRSLSRTLSPTKSMAVSAAPMKPVGTVLREAVSLFVVPQSPGFVQQLCVLFFIFCRFLGVAWFSYRRRGCPSVNI